MSISSLPSPRRLRRLVTVVAAAVGIGAGMLAIPTAADAIPPGGYCYSDWYDVQSVNGVAQHPLIPTRSFQNSSSSTTVNWTESYTNSTTYTSSYSTTTSFQGGVDLGIIKLSVNSSTTVTTTESITVTTTSSFTAPVPPLTTAYADYGTYGEQTSGVYNQMRYSCDAPDDYPKTTTSGSLSAFSLTSVGWHYWDTNGGSGNL